MRRTRILLVISILAALAVLATTVPASAAVTGGGTVVGSVTITSPATGIPTLTSPKVATTYRFSGISITGLFRSANKGTFIGQIKIPAGVTGGSPSENALGGNGSVNFFSFSGTGVGTISGGCSGTFKRNLSIVVVNLNCNVMVAGKPSQPAKVQVIAQFTPTNGNGITTGIKSASFAGVYRST